MESTEATTTLDTLEVTARALKAMQVVAIGFAIAQISLIIAIK